jgi:putative ABC transport system ATP-binding protein
MQPYISVKEVSKVYIQGDAEIRALDNVSVDINDGEFVAMMGPSGSGKTTLLNMIAGIDKQTTGTIVVGGQNLGAFTDRQLTAWRTRGIGYIFQFYNLIPVLTAYENVELPLLTLDMSKKERHDHVIAALEAVNIANRMTHFPRQLSGGQEQRVAIARAIVTDAKLLVADEPTGNLDAESEKNIMELIAELNKRHQKTVIMVTHDLVAAKYAGRVLHLEKGKLKM